MELSIAKRFLLLAQHPEKGRMLISEIHLKFGLAGALLLQMSLDDQLSIKDEVLYIKKGSQYADPKIREIAAMIQQARRPRKIKYWIHRIGQKASKWRLYYYDQMAQERLIKVEMKKFLGIIPYLKTYLVNRQLRNKMIQELKNEFFQKRDIAPTHMVVLGLVEACRMHKVLTKEKSQYKVLRRDLKQLVKESPVSSNVDKTISQVQAAIVSSIVVTTIASNVGTS